MKSIYLSAFTACIICFTSCKNNNNADEAEITEPVEAIEIPMAATGYAVDTVSSVIYWKGSKPTGSHTGTIRLAKGKIFVSNDTLESGSFTINMRSINVTDPAQGEDKTNLENHLKGLKKGNEDHFFNTQKYPNGKFEITGITKQDTVTLLEGNLTLKDITKNIKFPAEVNITSDSVFITSDMFKIDRTLWKINYSSKSMFNNIGDKYINDEIELRVKVRSAKE